MSVSVWLGEMLRGDVDDEPQQVKVTVRLDPDEYVDLKNIAQRLEISATKAATGLLAAAISEAINDFQLRSMMSRGEYEERQEEAIREHHEEQRAMEIAHERNGATA